MSAMPDAWRMAVVGMAVASLLPLLLRRDKGHAEVVFAVFCGSLSLTMLQPSLEHSSTWLFWATALGGCATCNAYWLFARALFRGDDGVRAQHVLVALGIAVLIVLYRLAQWYEGTADVVGVPSVWTVTLGGVLSFASSAVLMLAFLEALRGWSDAMPRVEKRLRVSFMAVFGSCVVAGTVTGAWAEVSPALAALRPIVIALCALSILLFTNIALQVRRRHPWPRSLALGSQQPAQTVAEEDRRLAEAVRRLLEHDAVYREPELKVADLAQRLGTAEYRVSRAITQALGERNFNRLVNRYRIAHARRRLEDPSESRSVLEICLDSGFASPGPFNRAFKEATGQPPSVYRAEMRRTQSMQTQTTRSDASRDDPALALAQAARD